MDGMRGEFVAFSSIFCSCFSVFQSSFLVHSPFFSFSFVNFLFHVSVLLFSLHFSPSPHHHSLSLLHPSTPSFYGIFSRVFVLHSFPLIFHVIMEWHLQPLLRHLGSWLCDFGHLLYGCSPCDEPWWTVDDINTIGYIGGGDGGGGVS